MIQLTRSQAKRRGLVRYFSGKPCPRGHLAERQTSNGNCCECHLPPFRKSRAKKPPRQPGQCTACGETKPLTAEFFVLIKNKAKGWSGWSAECRACRNTRFREHYADNRENM